MPGLASTLSRLLEEVTDPLSGNLLKILKWFILARNSKMKGSTDYDESIAKWRGRSSRMDGRREWEAKKNVCPPGGGEIESKNNQSKRPANK